MDRKKQKQYFLTNWQKRTKTDRNREKQRETDRNKQKWT